MSSPRPEDRDGRRDSRTGAARRRRRGAAEEPPGAGRAGAAAPDGRLPATGAATGVTRALAPVGRALASRRAPRIRTGVALFLVVVSVLAVLVSTLALWSSGVVFDTETYVKIVAPVAEDPEVRKSVSIYVAGKAVEAADLEQAHRGRTAGRRQGARPRAHPGAAELSRRRDRQVPRYPAGATTLGGHQPLRPPAARHRPAGQEPVRHRRTQRREAEPPAAGGRRPAAAGDQDPAAPRQGRHAAPRSTPPPPRETIRTLLQDALGRPLPADFGQITLLRGSQGYEAKQALRLFKDLVILVVVVTIVLIAAALLVSVRRWRTALWLGLGSLLAFIAARVIEVRLENAVVGAVKSPGRRGGGALDRRLGHRQPQHVPRVGRRGRRDRRRGGVPGRPARVAGRHGPRLRQALRRRLGPLHAGHQRRPLDGRRTSTCCASPGWSSPSSCCSS